MGHVNNAVFLTYIESARAAFLQHLGAVQTLEDLAIIVARIEIDFRAPVRFGDEVEVERARQPLRREELRPRARAARRRHARRRGEDACSSPTTTSAASRSRSPRRGGRSWPHERLRAPHPRQRPARADAPTCRQVQSVTCMIMLAAGSRYETPDTNGIAHFAEHMFFKGTERRPTAREIGMEVDGLGGEFNAFTSKEYTGYYVKCAAEYRDRRARRARRHAPQLEVRARGDRAREGRDRRGDEHVLRHAARLHRRRLRPAPLRRPAARLGHHRQEGDGARGRSRHVPRLRRPLVQARADGRRPRRQARRRPARDGRSGCSATSRRRRPARRPRSRSRPTRSRR